MLTKILLTLSLISLTGCKNLPKDFPKFPSEVKHQYMLDIQPNGEGDYTLRCWRYPIVSTNPYVLGDPQLIDDPLACRYIGGYLPREAKLVTNFNDLFYMWLDRHFKKEHRK